MQFVCNLLLAVTLRCAPTGPADPKWPTKSYDLKDFVETLTRAVDEIEANVATSLRARRSPGNRTEVSPGGGIVDILDELTGILKSLTKGGS